MKRRTELLKILKHTNKVSINLTNCYIAFFVKDTNNKNYIGQQALNYINAYQGEKTISLLYDIINVIQKSIYHINYTDTNLKVFYGDTEFIEFLIDDKICLEYKEFIKCIFKIKNNNYLKRLKYIINNDRIKDVYIYDSTSATYFDIKDNSVYIIHNSEDPMLNNFNIINPIFKHLLDNNKCDSYSSDDDIKKIHMGFENDKNITLFDTKNKNNYQSILETFKNKLIDDKIEEKKKVKVIKNG